jgi:hypothetical protein
MVPPFLYCNLSMIFWRALKADTQLLWCLFLGVWGQGHQENFGPTRLLRLIQRAFQSRRSEILAGGFNSPNRSNPSAMSWMIGSIFVRSRFVVGLYYTNYAHPYTHAHPGFFLEKSHPSAKGFPTDEIFWNKSLFRENGKTRKIDLTVERKNRKNDRSDIIREAGNRTNIPFWRKRENPSVGQRMFFWPLQ